MNDMEEKTDKQVEAHQTQDDAELPVQPIAEVQPQRKGHQADSLPSDLRTLVVGENWTSYILVTVGLLILLGLTIWGANLWVRSTAERLLEDFKLEKPPTECKMVADADKLGYLNRQRADIVKYGENHRKTAMDFYGYFYATFAVFSLFGLLSVITLALISKKGYDNTSPHLVTVFLVSTGIVILYQGFFGVFQQKANIDNNEKLYSNYSKLLTKIDTYCTTGKIPIIDPATVFNVNGQTTNPNPTQPASATPLTAPDSPKAARFYIALDADEFINYVGWQMEQYKAISIALDDKQITSIDNSKLLLP